MTGRALVPVLVVAALVAAAQPTHGSDRVGRSRHATITSGLDCSACHTPESWRMLEGSPSGGGFDHGRTGFPLTGRHQQTACTGCHRGGARSLARACVSCHQDAHAGRLGQACDRCHSAVGWNRSIAFERHRFTRLPLTGMHALADCTECHRPTTDRVFRNVPADCYACHAADYRRQDIHPVHTGVPGDPTRPPLPRNCAECHRATGWLPALITNQTFGVSRAPLAAVPNRAAPTHEALFPVRTGKHRGADCASCHSDLRVPALVRCDGCHAHDAARLQKQHRTAVSTSAGSCLGCHRGGAAR